MRVFIGVVVVSAVIEICWRVYLLAFGEWPQRFGKDSTVFGAVLWLMVTIWGVWVLR